MRLVACPFCGYKKPKLEVCDLAIADITLFAVVCGRCASSGPQHLTSKKAGRAWNTRNDQPSDSV